MSQIKFELSFGSEILRDGMFLELSVRETSPLRQIAEVFYSDVTHEFFFDLLRREYPSGSSGKTDFGGEDISPASEARTIHIAQTTYQCPLLAHSGPSAQSGCQTDTYRIMNLMET
ncbi:hypothetical protein [Pantoea ananatis]|uniref:hypothetical protein n=1 Tax=Pantoea ananas TaxID=553 RepID=UPI00301897E3